MCCFRKYPYPPPAPPPHRRDWNFLGGRVGGSAKPKKIKKCIKLDWNLLEGWGILRRIFCDKTMGILWNYTQCLHVGAKISD